MEQESETLASHGYQLKQELGKGGYSSCYLVTSKRYSLDFACKITPKDRLPQKQDSHREINMTIASGHPNVIQAFDYFDDDNKVYIILEYCPGGSLSDLIKKGGKISSSKKLSIASDILKAVSYCHASGIAHSDIKPDNILIDRFGRAKLSDFGLAQIPDDEQLSENFSGSLKYAAPEVSLRKPYDPFKADMWSIGVTLFTLATGHSPWRTDSIPNLFRMIQRGYYALPPNAEPELANVVARCIIVNPDERANITELMTMDIAKQPRRSHTLEVAGKRPLKASASGYCFGTNRRVVKLQRASGQGLLEVGLPPLH